MSLAIQACVQRIQNRDVAQFCNKFHCALARIWSYGRILQWQVSQDRQMHRLNSSCLCFKLMHLLCHY